MQHEAALFRHRPAVQYRARTDRGVGIHYIELFKQAAQVQLERPVDDDAKRAVRVMFANQRDGAAEVGVIHPRHCDK